MAQPTESQIRQAWEVYGQPQGIPYADYRAQVIATGSIVPTGASSSSGTGRGGGMGDDTTTNSGGAGFLTDLAHLTSGDIAPDTATKGDGSLDYYKQQSAKIQEALNSPGVSNERKQELRKLQSDLDAQYLGPRTEDATKTLQNAGSDDEALKALQALEGLETYPTGTSGTAAGGGNATSSNPGRLDPSLANGLPSYDPNDESQLLAAWEAGPKWQGVSFEEYKKQVKAANPTGARRYTDPTAKDLDGTPKTFVGIPDPSTAPGSVTAGSNAAIQRAAALGYYDNVTSRANQELSDKNKQTDQTIQEALGRLRASGDATKAKTTAYADDLSKAAAGANDESRAAQSRLTGAVDNYENENNAALSGYISGIAPYQHEIAGTTRQNVAFDPEGLAAQRAALAQGQAIAGGSLDYTSQAAQAYADPADVARTLEGLDMLRTNATSGGNDQRENLQIARDEYAHGGENQQHIYDLALEQLQHGGDQQRQVYNRYEDISHPEMTADERNILAQSQRQYATLDKSNRDAVMKDLEARNVSSGAAQIANQQASQQQLGEERVAGTLGAQAEAVQRALIGLQGMQTTADSIRTGDQNSLGLASKAATDLRTGNQNAEVLMQNAANALRAGDLAAAQAFTSAAQRQREEGFQEEYARGTAADNASANNQSTRLGGAQIQANEANSIRTANDAVNMFNNEQQGITDRFNTSFQQSEYNRLTGLQQQTFNNKNSTSDANLGAEERLHTSTEDAITGRFGRTNTADQTGIGVAMGNWGIDEGIEGATIDQAGASQGRTERETGRRIDTATNRITLDKDTADALSRLGYGI